MHTIEQTRVLHGQLRSAVLSGILCGLLVLASTAAEASDGTRLVFLGNKNIAPVVYLDSGTPAGVVVDIIHALEKHIPQPVEIRAMDWAEAQALVARGDADALIQINETEERRKIYDFSDTLLESQFSIFVSADRVGISGVSSLQGLRVGVEAGGLPRQVLEKNAHIPLTIIPNFLEGFKLLNAGSIDAVVVDYRVGSYVVAESKLRNIRIVGDPVAFAYSSIAVKKGNVILLAAINQALQAIKSDGTYQKILDKWKPTEVVFETREQIRQKTYYVTVGILLILFLIAILWTVTLRKELTKRKATEEKLRQINERFYLSNRAARLGVWDLDLQKNELVWDDRMYELYGVKREEFTGAYEAWLKGVHPDDRATSDEISRQAQRGEMEYDTEFRVVWPDNSIHNIKAFGQFIKDADGKPLRMTGVNYDITERKCAEAALTQLAAIVESSRDAIIGKTTDGIITSWNQGAELIYGYSADEIIGKHITALSSPSRHAEINELLEKAREGVAVVNHESERIRKDGALIQVALTLSPIRDESGNISGISTIARDITERKLNEAVNASRLHLVQFSLRHSLDELLEETLNETEKLTGSVIGFYHFVEDDQNFLTLQNWSKSTKDVFCKAEGKGMHYPIDEAGVWVDCVRQAKAVIHNDYASLPNRKGMPEGHATVIRELVVPVFRGEKVSAILGVGNKPTNYTEKDVATVSLFANLAFEIAERKIAEDKINEFNHDLELRVVERTAQLAVANKELEAFSYSVSHDLRTPLRAIDGFSHILLEDYADKLDDEGKRLLNVVRDNTSRMGQLIDDILAFSRTGQLNLSFSEIDMEKLAREVFEEIQPSVDYSNLQLEFEAIPPSTGDRAMMHQLFVNLLSNAIKFSRTRELAIVKVGGSIKGGEAVYYVKDNGVGFDMQYADKLFGVFQRLHSVNEFEGTGIGLAIVKRIITRHGGRVWAESKVNEGATIYFALPNKESRHE